MDNLGKKTGVQRRGLRKVSAGTCFAFALGVAAVLPSGYLVQTPGLTLNVNSTLEGKPIVQIDNAQTYQSDTQFLLTTVSSYGTADHGISGAMVFSSYFQKNAEIIPVRHVYPAEVTEEVVSQHNQQMMTNSQEAAEIVALELAGMPVSMDIKVVELVADAPSSKVLQVNDILRGIRTTETGDFTEVKSHYQLAQVLDKVQPGKTIWLQVERQGQIVEVSFATRPYKADDTGWTHPGSLIGVHITIENIEKPSQVNYLVPGIGGPSAGNIFALNIYDQLTPGSLGGDKRIAGSGTVAWNGEVGAIGGIHHKLQGAARDGATDFFVPATNCLETVGYEPAGLRLWAVRSTVEAIKVVEAIAKNDTANLTTCQDVVAQSKGVMVASAKN